MVCVMLWDIVYDVVCYVVYYIVCDGVAEKHDGHSAQWLLCMMVAQHNGCSARWSLSTMVAQHDGHSARWSLSTMVAQLDGCSAWCVMTCVMLWCCCVVLLFGVVVLMSCLMLWCCYVVLLCGRMIDFMLFLDYGNWLTDWLMDEQTFVLLESLSQLKIGNNDLTTDEDIHCKHSKTSLLHRILDGIRDSLLWPTLVRM